MNDTGAAAESFPPVLLGLSWGSWTFAMRVWLACLLALYLCFWLELDSPSTAAVTVAVLAFPTRGQTIEKAGFRLLATAVGVVASIVIAGIFSETGSLLVIVFGVWLALCAYAAAMLDGNRAYAASLSGITVALITIDQIDSPLQVFSTCISRGADITIGVLASALVNEIMGAPDYHPILADRLLGLQRQVIDYVDGVAQGHPRSLPILTGLFSNISSLRAEVASLATEASSGNARSAAAQSAMAGMVTELSLACALTGTIAAAKAGLSIGTEDKNMSARMAETSDWLKSEISNRRREVRRDLEALKASTPPLRRLRAPIYRSRRLAAETGIRAAVQFLLVALVLVLGGWPATELCLSLAAVVIALSVTAPDPRVFRQLTIMALPTACLLAGFLEYYVLDGVSEFPLLAIGLAPAVIGLALLISLPSGRLPSYGRLTLVFTLIVLAPTNPQTYDPQAFATTCLFVCLSAILVFLAQLLVPPASNERRLRILLSEFRLDLRGRNLHARPHLEPEAAAFRDATLVEQILTASAGSPRDNWAADEALRCFDQAAALRRCCAQLNNLVPGPLFEQVRTARAALAVGNTDMISSVAESLRKAATDLNINAASSCASLLAASIAFWPPGTMFRCIGTKCP